MTETSSFRWALSPRRAARMFRTCDHCDRPAVNLMRASRSGGPLSPLLSLLTRKIYRACDEHRERAVGQLKADFTDGAS